jgi:hypothetical protein
MKPNPALAKLKRLVGTWRVTGSHPLLPGRVLHGTGTFTPIEGGAFIRVHTKMKDREIPEGVAILGTDDGLGTCTMVYFDSRGVSRRYDVELHANGFSWSRNDPKFRQRFRVKIAKNGRTMEGEGSMKRPGKRWEPDLRLSYVRAPKRRQ